MIREAIEALVNRRSLTWDEATQVMNEIMSGEATPAQFAAFVTALRLKGEAVDEIGGMAQVMREKALRVHVDGALLDTCGTGGDGSHTFNISTAASFVVAGAGVKVAKHGNRAMSGACGSADVLEALGVGIDLGPESVQRCIDEVGFGFMFAQRYHPSMRFAAAPRKEIGIRNVFNVLGPLTNPAGAKFHLMGVADPNVGEKMAQVLSRLGSTHAFVVHGLDGLDEISLSDDTRVWEMKDASVSSYVISPQDVGLDTAPREELAVDSVESSTAMLRRVLKGEGGPSRDVVLLNAAAALVAAERATSLEEGTRIAAESVDSGKAMHTLEAVVELTQTLE